jgi:hypothetical protein
VKRRSMLASDTDAYNIDDQLTGMKCLRAARNYGGWLAIFVLCSCANHHFRLRAEGPPAHAPRYVELLAEKQVATLHFPAGLYSFYAVDDTGTYYRSPRPVIQRTGGGSVRRNGGVYVSRRHPTKMRGYVFYAGALTHVGDLSAVPHVTRY